MLLLPNSAKEKALKKFIDLYQQKKGIILGNQEALEHLEMLITLTRATYRPVPCSYEKELERLTPKHDNEKLET